MSNGCMLEGNRKKDIGFVGVMLTLLSATLLFSILTGTTPSTFPGYYSGSLLSAILMGFGICLSVSEFMSRKLRVVSFTLLILSIFVLGIYFNLF